MLSRPPAFFARTWKRYAEPFTSPVTVADVLTTGLPLKLVKLPAAESLYWRSYPVMARPPLSGSDQLTVTCVLPGVWEMMVGGAGFVKGMPEDGSEVLLPSLLSDVTVTL